MGLGSLQPQFANEPQYLTNICPTCEAAASVLGTRGSCNEFARSWGTLKIFETSWNIEWDVMVYNGMLWNSIETQIFIGYVETSWHYPLVKLECNGNGMILYFCWVYPLLIKHGHGILPTLMIFVQL